MLNKLIYSLPQTSNKDTGAQNTSSSQSKYKDTNTKDDPFKYQRSGDGQAQSSQAGKGKYSDDRYDTDARKAGDKPSGERHDRRTDRTESDRPYKSYGDVHDVKNATYDRNERRDEEGYRGNRGHGDYTNEITGSVRRHSDQRGKYPQESGDYTTGKYVSGTFNGDLTGVNLDGDLNIHDVNNETNQDDHHDSVHRNSSDKGKHSRDHLPGFGEPSEHHVHFSEDTKKTNLRTNESTDSLRDTGERSNDDAKWATLANQVHMRETRRQFKEESLDEYGRNRRHSNLLVHNIGGDMNDELIHDRYNAYSKSIHNVGEHNFNDHMATYMNLYNEDNKLSDGNSTNNTQVSQSSDNRAGPQLNNVNMFDRKTALESIETNAFERSESKLDGVEEPDEKYGYSKARTNTAWNHGNNDPNEEVNKLDGKSLQNTSTGSSQALKDLSTDFEAPGKHSTALGLTEPPKAGSDKRFLRQYSNKIDALQAQHVQIKDAKSNGFPHKMRVVWNKMPRHLKRILFVVLVFALFAFVLTRIVLHTKERN